MAKSTNQTKCQYKLSLFQFGLREKNVQLMKLIRIGLESEIFL